MASTDTLTGQASEAAILSVGRRTVLTTTLVDADDARLQDPDPWKRPDTSDVGFLASDTVAADCRVVFHRDSQTRTVYLVVNEVALASALTGNFVVEVDTVSSTYDATAGAPADVDALLEAWRDQINVDLSASVVASVVAYKNPAGANDAIRLVGIPEAAVPESGLPAGTEYTTYALGASTSCPEAAALWICREVDSADLAILTKSAATQSAAVEENHNYGTNAHRNGWALNREVGALDDRGYDERLNLARRSAAWIQLSSLVVTDETFTIVSSGVGIYGVTNLATAYVAPQAAV